MRKLIFGVASSLDNFIARADGGIDWLRFSDDANKIMAEMWENVDCVIMGRKTYELTKDMGGGAVLPGMKNYVFTRTLEAGEVDGVQIVNGDAETFVRDLKSQEGKDICCLGGAVLATSLFEADLIDEVGVNVHPVLLGSGAPLFPGLDRQIDLELEECRPIAQDCVSLTYRVKR